MIFNLSIHLNLYHFYLDLNKAFNSVPHEAIWRIFHNYNFPSQVIPPIRLIYSWPADYPAVNDFTLSAATTPRGLRQGYPLSSNFSNFFSDSILSFLKHLLPKDVFHELFFFINDVDVEIPSPRLVHTTLKFLFTIGPKHGLSFHASKSELHGPNDTLHITFRTTPFPHFSPCDTKGNPRRFYKYLPTYCFNNQRNGDMLALLTNTITYFFNSLAPLPLTHTEIIKCSNI